jgi:hypothetical protein
MREDVVEAVVNKVKLSLVQGDITGVLTGRSIKPEAQLFWKNAAKLYLGKAVYR